LGLAAQGPWGLGGAGFRKGVEPFLPLHEHLLTTFTISAYTFTIIAIQGWAAVQRVGSQEKARFRAAG